MGSVAWSGRNDPARMRRVSVRPANAADSEAIGSILNALLATTAIEWTDTPHTADSILEWLDHHETVLVAEEGGEVVGVAAFGWFRDVTKWPGYRFTVENTVHVREDHWGSGVGRELMEELIDEARRGGKHTMVAAVDGANEASVRFHERLGFVEVARMPRLVPSSVDGRISSFSSCTSMIDQKTLTIRVPPNRDGGRVSSPHIRFRRLR